MPIGYQLWEVVNIISLNNCVAKIVAYMQARRHINLGQWIGRGGGFGNELFMSNACPPPPPPPPPPNIIVCANLAPRLPTCIEIFGVVSHFCNTHTLHIITLKQVQSVEVVHPHLTKSLATKLTGSLETLSHLNEVTITNPHDVVELPHLIFLRLLKISGLSPICDDWLWMKDIKQLQVLELHIRDANVTTTEEEAANDSSKLLIHHQKTDITINGVDSAKLICQVLKCLPSYFRDEVSSSCRTHNKTVETRESCFLKQMRNRSYRVHYLVGVFKAFIIFRVLID